MKTMTLVYAVKLTDAIVHLSFDSYDGKSIVLPPQQQLVEEIARQVRRQMCDDARLTSPVSEYNLLEAYTG